MKSVLKKIIIVFVTLLVLILAMIGASKILTPRLYDGTRSNHTFTWEGFYKEEKNTVDVLFVGPSTVYYGISPTEMYDEYGFTGFDLASANQTGLIAELYIREALRYQSPKLIVLDQTVFLETEFNAKEGLLHSSLDSLKFSWDKVKTAAVLAKNTEGASFLSYIFPLLRYHSLWEETLEEGLGTNLVTEEGLYSLKGYLPSSVSQIQTRKPMYQQTSDKVDEKYDELGLEQLQRIADLCKENGIELLVIKMPVLTPRHTMARSLGTQKLCDSLGITYLDLNLEEHWTAMGLDPANDFQSQFHTSLEGSDILSHYLASYIDENYDLPDHRDDPAYSSWEEAVAGTRIDNIERIEMETKNKKTTSGFRVYYIDGNAEITWNRMSYTTDVKLYRQIGDGERAFLTDTEDAYYLDENVSKDAQYYLEYTLDDVEEPVTIQTGILYPATMKKTADKQFKITIYKYYGASEFELFRQASDGSWTSIAKDSLESATTYTDKKAGSNSPRYLLQYTDVNGNIQTYEFGK